jgi:starvation-inducible DNA-binding protein
MEHVEALANLPAEFGKRIRKSIDEAAALGDSDTADLFTEISRGLDTSLWMLEAHLG